jgi:hypothetical protein
MLALRELQLTFYAAMMNRGEGEDALLAAIEETDEAGRRRIDAYRRTVFGTLSGALLATYPVVARIVGMPFFREATRCYLLAHPSRSGDLNEYGGDFADFLAEYPHAGELSYLPDVARLEWLVQAVYYAADPPAADLSALAAADPSRWGEFRFSLTTAWARMDSPHPLHDIWRVNAEGYDDDMAVDFARGASVMILRRGGMVHVLPLAAGTAGFVDAIAGGANLAQATASAIAADGDFEPAPALQNLVRDGVIVGAFVPATDAMGDEHAQP